MTTNYIDTNELRKILREWVRAEIDYALAQTALGAEGQQASAQIIADICFDNLRDEIERLTSRPLSRK